MNWWNGLKIVVFTFPLALAYSFFYATYATKPIITKAEYQANPELLVNETLKSSKVHVIKMEENFDMSLKADSDAYDSSNYDEIWKYMAIGFSKGFPVEKISGFINNKSYSEHLCRWSGNVPEYHSVDYSAGINVVGEDFKNVFYQDSEVEKPFSASWTVADAIKGAKLTFKSEAKKSNDVWQVAKTWIKFHWKYDKEDKGDWTLYIITAATLETNSNNKEILFSSVVTNWKEETRIFFDKTVKTLAN